MDVIGRASAFAASPHTGRAMTLMKAINFVGTVRGAVTTVLLAASAIGGGAVTVNTVRHEMAVPTAVPARAVARTVAPTTAPTATPLTATGLQADIEKRLGAALAADSQAADDLRKVAVFSGPRLDQLIDETKQKLQTRYDQGIAQLAALLGTGPVASGSPRPSGSPSVIAANALAQVILGDLNGIVVGATRAATEPTPLPRTPVPTVAPTPLPRTPSPSPTHSPSPRPSPTR